MAQRGGLEFPPDLFYNILFYVKDLPNLWNYRQISRDFAKAVEQVFINKHMNKPILRIDCRIYSQQHGRVIVACNFEFDRIDPLNPSRTIFAQKQCAEEFQPALKKRLRSQLEYGNNARYPQFHVQIRRELNDTAIPGLELDYDKLEASFDWKGLYSAFFLEEREYKKRLKDRMTDMKAEALKMRARVESRELSYMESIQAAFFMFAGTTKDLRQEVRRDRISRQIFAEDGVNWNWRVNEDAHDLIKLNEARKWLWWGEPYSDESASGSEAEAGGEDESMDECEDKDGGMDEDEDEEYEGVTWTKMRMATKSMNDDDENASMHSDHSTS